MKSNINKTTRLDELDAKIINELLDDAKTPLRTVATKLKVSFVTIMNRIKRLEQEGIIQGYTVKVNYEKLGYDVHVLIELRISKGKLLELERKIAEQPNVYTVFDVTGDVDAVIVGRFDSTKAMDLFLKKIQAWDFVERTHTKLILHTIKQGDIRIT